MTYEVTGKGNVIVRSLFGFATRKPFVNLIVKDVFVTLTPDEAREIGANLIEAGSAAIADAAVFEMGKEFTKTTKGDPDKHGGLLLEIFRQTREKMEGG